MRLLLIFTLIFLSFNSYSQRIISTMPSLTEMAFFLELEERLVGVTPYCKYPIKAKKILKIGSAFSLDYEKVVKVKPEVALFGPVVSGRVEQDLSKLKVKVLKLKYERLSDIVDSLYKMNSYFNANKFQAISKLERSISEKKKASGKKVLIVIGEDIENGNVLRLQAAGKGTFYDDILMLLGAHNVASASKYPSFNLEALLRLKPDIIIRVGNNLSLKSDIRQKWKSTLFKDKVQFIFKDYAVIPGPRIVQLITDMEEHL